MVFYFHSSFALYFNSTGSRTFVAKRSYFSGKPPTFVGTLRGNNA